LETTQPIVSNLINGRISGFSLERLVRFLNALDRDVDIVVRRKTRGATKARVKVEFAG
jgi:predicted XRE-type DNA-binding protein